MKLTIHRGAHTIGGSCVEIRTAKTRVIIDLGIPLTDNAGNRTDTRKISKKSIAELIKDGILPDIPGLFSRGETDIDAVLISHSHRDHYGFLKHINPGIPVYMSEGCKEIIDVAHYFGQTDYDPKDAKIRAPWQEFRIGDIKVVPYLVDHPAFDAFAYLVEADGKRVFYSGDFRGHGGKSVLFENIVKNPPKDIDVLVVEGTTIGRRKQELWSEDAVLKEMIDICRNNTKLILLACSSQNIDRLIVAYKACRKTGKILVLDPYTAYILERINREGVKIPQFNWDNMRVFFAGNEPASKLAKDGKLYKFLSSYIGYDEIEEKKENLVVMDSYFTRGRFGQKGYLKNALLVHSQWHEYLEKNERFWKKYGVDIVEVHTSGHAYENEIRKFINALDPFKIVPIHTLHPERFVQIFGDKVTILEDGQSLEI